jgi:hypothetical protein
MARFYLPRHETCDDIVCDPWHMHAEEDAALPDDARFACAYELFVAFEWFDEAAFFRRTETTDELWTASGGCPAHRARGPAVSCGDRSRRATLTDIGCAYAVRKRDDESASCLGLLDRLFHARVGFCWPERFIAGEIVEKSGYEWVVRGLKKEVDRNEREARARETGIIRTARELGLAPRPAGTGPDHWFANCPGKNHPLYITTTAGSFGCGWCRRKGGVGELRAFVEERAGTLVTKSDPIREPRRPGGEDGRRG